MMGQSLTCTLPPKRNATLGSGAPMNPVYGQQPLIQRATGYRVAVVPTFQLFLIPFLVGSK